MWNGPRTLRDCFPNLRSELEPFIPNYAIHVIEVAFLTPEEIKRLKSDFRFVADYLTQTRTGRDYVPSDGRIVHVDETLKLLGAITGDNTFQESINALEEEGKEGVTMCDVVRQFRNEGREEARKEYETVLADKERVLADRERELEEMARELLELKSRYGLA